MTISTPARPAPTTAFSPLAAGAATSLSRRLAWRLILGFAVAAAGLLGVWGLDRPAGAAA